MGVFTDDFLTTWLRGQDRWRVEKTYEFHSGEKCSGLFVRVPRGLVTDLASIPLAVRWLIPRAGRYAQAAALHDVAYRDGAALIRVGEAEDQVPISRGVADALMNEAMIALDVRLWRRHMIHKGLVVGGWWTWNKYRRQGKGIATETTR